MTPSPAATSTRASRAARRSAWRCSRWPSSSPSSPILDETDSGLDIDALRIVAEGVNAQLSPDLGVLLITHYQRLLNYIQPDRVHVLAHGRIIASGGKDLALRLEDEGYAPILQEAGFDVDALDEDPEVERLEERGGLARRLGQPTDRRRRHDPMNAPAPLDPEVIRRDFPLFEREFHGQRLAYLDSAATALKPRVGVRGGRRLQPPLQRQRASRHLHHRRGGHRGLRGCPGEGRALHQRARLPRDRLRAQRHRGHQPGGLRLGPRTTSAAPTPSC